MTLARFVAPLLVAVFVSLSPLAARAQARTFVIRNDGGSRIQFVSDAPLETITGVSSHVTGELSVDPQNLATARGRVNVQIASIRTGIDLRDEHLRADNWLDAGRYPQAVFEITGVEGASTLPPNEMQRLRLRGRFTLHGVTREIVAEAQVRLVPSARSCAPHGSMATSCAPRPPSECDCPISAYRSQRSYSSRSRTTSR